MFISFCYSVPKKDDVSPTRLMPVESYAKIHPTTLVRVSDKHGEMLSPYLWGRRSDKFVNYCYVAFTDVKKNKRTRLGMYLN